MPANVYLCYSTPQICLHLPFPQLIIARPISVSLTFSKIKALSCATYRPTAAAALPLVYQYSLTRGASIFIIIAVINIIIPPSSTIFWYSCFGGSIVDPPTTSKRIFLGYRKITYIVRLDRCVVNTDQGYTGNGPRAPWLRDRPPSQEVPLGSGFVVTEQYVTILYILRSGISLAPSCLKLGARFQIL